MTLCSQRGRFGVGSREVRSGEFLSEEWVAKQKNLGSSSLPSTSFGRRLGKYTHCARILPPLRQTVKVALNSRKQLPGRVVFLPNRAS